jgi:hypothetical protein
MNGKWHDVGYLSSIAGSAPWWAKIAGKLVLSRLPVEHALWKRLGLFQYGAMEQRLTRIVSSKSTLIVCEG